MSVVLVGEGDLADICKLSLLQENLEIIDHLKIDSITTSGKINSKKLKTKLQNIAFL